MRLTLACLGVSVLSLLAWGLLVLASAGSENGLRQYHDPYHYIVRQAILLAASLPFFVAAMKFDYHKWMEHRRMTFVAYLLIAALMGLALCFPPVNGSRRWVMLGVGSFRLQPSEFAKLITVIATAVFIEKSGWAFGKFKRGACRAAGIVGLPVLLAVLEPDYGAAAVISATAAAVFLVGGMRIPHMLVLGAVGGVGVCTSMAFNSNRMNRIFSWVKSSSWINELFGWEAATQLSGKEQAAAHQADMALVAIRNGGVTGMGMNKSVQKLRYLPEAHTDFIFAIGAEEWGLIFSLSLLLLFTVFFVCGMIIAARAPDRLGRMIAYGITFLIFSQALLNIGVVTKCLPTKGLALPFISYGGTNLLSAVVAVGVLFNIGLQIELPKTRPRSTI